MGVLQVCKEWGTFLSFSLIWIFLILFWLNTLFMNLDFALLQMCLFGCNFWHWELEYISYLVEMGHIRGDDGVEALGWAEDRREELLLRKEEKRLAGATSAVKQVQAQDRVQVVQAED